MIDPIKAKIQELCPNVMQPVICHHECIECEMGKTERLADITLAVVLRAIKIKATRNEIMRLIVDLWNLENDNWDSQSAEAQAFVGGLLGL